MKTVARTEKYAVSNTLEQDIEQPIILSFGIYELVNGPKGTFRLNKLQNFLGYFNLLTDNTDLVEIMLIFLLLSVFTRILILKVNRLGSCIHFVQ